MNCLPKDKYLKFNENTLYEVRKTFDLHNTGAMEEAVDILDKWVKKQQHFVKKDFDKEYLETTIIVSKGSIEKAKARLDKGCVLRTLIPHVFGVFDIRRYYSDGLRDIVDAVLPRMTKNNERVYFIRNYGKKFDEGIMRHFVQYASMAAEYNRRHDYAVSNFVVIDYMEVNFLELVPRLTLQELQELIAMLLDCCGFRVGGIYLVSNLKFVEIVAKIFKQLLSSKIGERIHILKDLDSLYRVFGDILPQEYGGKEKPLKELQNEWLETLTSEEHCEYLRQMSLAKTEESLRPKDQFHEHYMGLPGTFRTLNVD